MSATSKMLAEREAHISDEERTDWYLLPLLHESIGFDLFVEVD